MGFVRGAPPWRPIRVHREKDGVKNAKDSSPHNGGELGLGRLDSAARIASCERALEVDPGPGVCGKRCIPHMSGDQGNALPGRALFSFLGELAESVRIRPSSNHSAAASSRSAAGTSASICGAFSEEHLLLQLAAQIENAASLGTKRPPAYGQPMIRFEVTRLAPRPSVFALFFGCYLPIFSLIPFSVFPQPILTSSLCSFRHPINLPPPGVMPGHIRSASALQESSPAALTV